MEEMLCVPQNVQWEWSQRRKGTEDVTKQVSDHIQAWKGKRFLSVPPSSALSDVWGSAQPVSLSR